jgi:hypothetical protein
MKKTKLLNVLFEIKKYTVVSYFALLEGNFELTKTEVIPSDLIFCNEEFVCHKNGFYVFALSNDQRVAVTTECLKIYKFI